MVSLLALRALVGLLKGAERPLFWVRDITGYLAGVKRGERKHAMHLDLWITSEDFRRIIEDNHLKQAYEEAEALKAVHQVPMCTRCGALHRA